MVFPTREASPDAGGGVIGEDARADARETTPGDDAATRPRASCAGLPKTCGPTGEANCCDSRQVPGGTFFRGTGATDPATVGTFFLDTYEITVGRFRLFSAAYPSSRPAPASGRSSSLSGDRGWDTTWDSKLPSAARDLVTPCDNTASTTWTSAPGANEAKAIDCISWAVAYAFCIWDGGRLPSEAEWTYAAVGGAEQRFYPWSTDATSLTPAHAIYSASAASVAAVGSKLPGNGRWMHADLAGNVAEWVLDIDIPYRTCNGCVELGPGGPLGGTRGARGGGFSDGPPELASARRAFADPLNGSARIGARCAHDI